MSTKLEQGQPVPNFKFTATNNLEAELKNYQGKLVVLYFYPKDNTPGCTNESKDFRDLYEKFKQSGAEIFGISRDTVASHENFKIKYELPFELIADPDGNICQLFKVIRPNLMFGKSILGIIRSTFVIDQKGYLIQEWRKVKVGGHALQVLEYIKENNTN